MRHFIITAEILESREISYTADHNNMASKRRKLNLQPRIEVVKRLNTGGTDIITNDFKVRETQLQHIKGKKAESLGDYEIYGTFREAKTAIYRELRNQQLWFKD